MLSSGEDLFETLLKTGWQSWSWGNPTKLIKIPTRNYSPIKIDISKIIVDREAAIHLKPAIKGWCSWYAFGSDIDEQKILNHCDWFNSNKKLKKFDHILVDDGWESAWGDWLGCDLAKFPSGLKNLSLKILEKGFKPGIWCAPFLVDPKSKFAREHPNWLVKKGKHFVDGRRITPFDRLFSYKRYILDVKNNEVCDYLDQVLDYLLVDCAFKAIKLDFLYGIYFSPELSVYEADQFLKSFLLKIRNKYPDVYTIGCGCPLIPAVGVVDSMRIGPDINVPALQNNVFLKRFSNRFSYKRAINNLKARTWTKKLWNCDPDVFLCSDKLCLSDKEITVLRDLIKELGGNVFLGDDMAALPASRVEEFIDF